MVIKTLQAIQKDMKKISLLIFKIELIDIF
jgi:hypothetical protein